MKPGSASTASPVVLFARLLTLLLGMSLAGAWADDYTDVTQLMRAGQLSEARDRVERHLSAKPRDPQMRYFRGLIERESGQTGAALATFTQLTEDFPELPEPYNGLAVIHAAQGQYDQARSALEAAVRANPAYAAAHENLGDVYLRLASQAYCKAMQYEPQNPTAKSKQAQTGTACRP